MFLVPGVEGRPLSYWIHFVLLIFSLRSVLEPHFMGKMLDSSIKK